MSGGRPKGTKNAPGTKTPGRKPQKLQTIPYEEILEGKVKLLKVLSSGEAVTIANAARLCGIKPTQAWSWSKEDKEFHELIEMSRQVAADDIEEDFRTHANFIPKMMLLKGYRPIFRDNYKFEFTTDKLEKLLAELKQLTEEKKEDTSA